METKPSDCKEFPPQHQEALEAVPRSRRSRLEEKIRPEVLGGGLPGAHALEEIEPEMRGAIPGPLEGAQELLERTPALGEADSVPLDEHAPDAALLERPRGSLEKLELSRLDIDLEKIHAVDS